jgi:hypothetical protein
MVKLVSWAEVNEAEQSQIGPQIRKSEQSSRDVEDSDLARGGGGEES